MRMGMGMDGLEGIELAEALVAEALVAEADQIHKLVMNLLDNVGGRPALQVFYGLVGTVAIIAQTVADSSESDVEAVVELFTDEVLNEITMARTAQVRH